MSQESRAIVLLLLPHTDTDRTKSLCVHRYNIDDDGRFQLRDCAKNVEAVLKDTKESLTSRAFSDFGPPQRQTSPVRRADPYATHEPSQSPSVWKGLRSMSPIIKARDAKIAFGSTVGLVDDNINPLTLRWSSSPWDGRTCWHPTYVLPPEENPPTRSPSPT